MKSIISIILTIAMVSACVIGCKPQQSSTHLAEAATIAEGVIFSVEYELQEGVTGGFIRINRAEVVPGGNGSWNVDAYRRLTKDYLIITYPQRKDNGPRIIPARRLVDIQFGDGGIKNVDETKSNAAG